MNRRKTVASGVIVLLLLILLGLEAVMAQEIKLTVMGTFPGTRKDYAQEIFSRFEAANPGVTIEISYPGGWNATYEAYTVQSAGGVAPDIILTDYRGAGIFAPAGLLEPLDTYIKNDNSFDLADFYPAALDLGTVNGTIFAIPQNAVTTVLYSNVDLLQQAGLGGPPKEFAALESAAKKLAVDSNNDGQADVYGVSTFNGVEGWANFLYPFGGSILNESLTAPTFTEPVALEAVKRKAEWVAQGMHIPVGVNRVGLFSNGTLAMAYDNPGFHNTLQQSAPDINYKVSLVPAGPAGSISWMAPHLIGISPQSKNKDLAWKFVSWWLSNEVDAEYHERLNYVPVKRSTFLNRYFLTHPVWNVFGQQLALTKAIPGNIPTWNEVKKTIQSVGLIPAWKGQEAAATAMESAAELVQTILDGK